MSEIGDVCDDQQSGSDGEQSEKTIETQREPDSERYDQYRENQRQELRMKR